MPRLDRLQYSGAIYHTLTPADGRRKLFHDDCHDERFTQGLRDKIDRSGWVVLAYCWMPNHIHALIKTPEPNLCRGMQHWLSGYANWYAKRNRRTGHLYQGRHKARLAFAVARLVVTWRRICAVDTPAQRCENSPSDSAYRIPTVPQILSDEEQSKWNNHEKPLVTKSRSKPNWA